MVEVFVTKVAEAGAATILTHRLLHIFPLCRITFDLEDCDKVLRVEGAAFCASEIMSLLQRQGFECRPM